MTAFAAHAGPRVDAQLVAATGPLGSICATTRAAPSTFPGARLSVAHASSASARRSTAARADVGVEPARLRERDDGERPPRHVVVSLPPREAARVVATTSRDSGTTSRPSPPPARDEAQDEGQAGRRERRARDPARARLTSR